jgi:hypothetical protein
MTRNEFVRQNLHAFTSEGKVTFKEKWLYTNRKWGIVKLSRGFSLN